MRAHAWAILAALTDSQPGAPSFNSAYVAQWDAQNWENKCTLGLAPGNPLCGSSAPAKPDDCPLPIATPRVTLEPPIQLGGKQFTSMASVRYNLSAARFIRERCLQTVSGLQRLAELEKDPSTSNLSSQFPGDAVIIKLIWAMPDANNPIGAWDNSLAQPGGNPNGIGQPNIAGTPWRRVYVNMDTAAPCNSRQYKTDKDTNYNRDTDAVPINCFYHRRFNCSEISGGSGVVPGNRTPCAPGQTTIDVVLTGVHIITAELKNWVWTTYWWTNRPDDDTQFGADRPELFKHRGQWSFYSMNTALSVDTPTDPGDGLARICFNPYLEGPEANGTVSNCLYCHQMAVYRSSGKPGTTEEFIAGHPRRCAYQKKITQDCLQLLQADAGNGSVLLPDAKYFEGAVGTHFLWSLANVHDAAALNRNILLQKVNIQMP
jgi:hypothetical protein